MPKTVKQPIVIETHRPLIHPESGLDAQLPGRYDFDFQPKHAAWLREQQKQGALTILEDLPTTAPPE